MKTENPVLPTQDMIIARKYSLIKDGDFMQLINLIQESDISVANLKALIHPFKGFPENFDQDTPMAGTPEIDEEIACAGFKLLAGTNNYAKDDDEIRTLENINDIARAGLKIADVGGDLHKARKPVFFDNRLKSALISAVSTFESRAKANNSTSSYACRPGINPVTLTAHHTFFYKIAQCICQFLTKKGIILNLPGKLNIKVKNRNISVEKEFSGFYTSDKLPSIYYDKQEADYSLRAEEVNGIAEKELNKIKIHWERLIPVIKMKNKKIFEILLYPISLGFGKPFGNKKTPYPADQITGVKIITKVLKFSIPFNTNVEYDDLTNIATIHL
jgi:hypothetical protein